MLLSSYSARDPNNVFSRRTLSLTLALGRMFAGSGTFNRSMVAYAPRAHTASIRQAFGIVLLQSRSINGFNASDTRIVIFFFSCFSSPSLFYRFGIVAARCGWNRFEMICFLFPLCHRRLLTICLQALRSTAKYILTKKKKMCAERYLLRKKKGGKKWKKCIFAVNDTYDMRTGSGTESALLGCTADANERLMK